MERTNTNDYKESPDQSKLIAMQDADVALEFLKDAVAAVRKAAGPGNIDRVLQEHDLDVIIAPSDSPLTTVAAIAGMRSRFTSSNISSFNAATRLPDWYNALGLPGREWPPVWSFCSG